MKNARARIFALICDIDDRIAAQVRRILDHDEVRALERSWRGLAFFILDDKRQRRDGVKVRLLSVSLSDLYWDMQRAVEFDASALYSCVVEDEFESPGGEPLGLLLYDFQLKFKSDIDWIAFMDHMACIAEAGFVPSLLGVDASVLGVDDFSDIEPIHTFFDELNHDSLRRFKLLQKKAAMRYLYLLLPPFLVLSRDYAEDVYANSIYLLAKNASLCFLESHWFSGMRKVTMNLPAPTLRYDGLGQYSGSALSCVLFEEQELELSLLGFCSVIEYPYGMQVGFRSIQSACIDGKTMASMLPYLLCACRFAHYVKVMMRDRVGAFINKEALEQDMQNWLFQYCGHVDAKNPSALSQYPLKNARISISPSPIDPGRFNCALDIAPHYHIETLQTKLTFATQIKNRGEYV